METPEVLPQEYDELVEEAAETRRFLDEELHPQFASLKKVFESVFPEFSGSAFKLLSDITYYQGGYPSENSPARGATVAKGILDALFLTKMVGNDQIFKLVGMTLKDHIHPPDDALVLPDKADIKDHWGQVMSTEIPMHRYELLKALLKRAQELQKEICQAADSIKVDAAEKAEKMGILKKSFMKTVSLAAMKKKGKVGQMAEKVEETREAAENLIKAIENLNP